MTTTTAAANNTAPNASSVSKAAVLGENGTLECPLCGSAAGLHQEKVTANMVVKGEGGDGFRFWLDGHNDIHIEFECEMCHSYTGESDDSDAAEQHNANVKHHRFELNIYQHKGWTLMKWLPFEDDNVFVAKYRREQAAKEAATAAPSAPSRKQRRTK